MGCIKIDEIIGIFVESPQIFQEFHPFLYILTLILIEISSIGYIFSLIVRLLMLNFCRLYLYTFSELSECSATVKKSCYHNTSYIASRMTYVRSNNTAVCVHGFRRPFCETFMNFAHVRIWTFMTTFICWRICERQSDHIHILSDLWTTIMTVLICSTIYERRSWTCPYVKDFMNVSHEHVHERAQLCACGKLDRASRSLIFENVLRSPIPFSLKHVHKT